MTDAERLVYNKYMSNYRRTVYYPSHKSQCIAYATAYRKKHPERFKEYVLRYKAKNELAFYMYRALREHMKRDKRL